MCLLNDDTDFKELDKMSGSFSICAKYTLNGCKERGHKITEIEYLVNGVVVDIKKF